MPRISAFFTNNGTPIAAPGNVPTIRIRRQDTQALVVTDLAMTEMGDGLFAYDFAEDPTLEYTFRCDGDPTVVGQVTVQERFVAGSFSGPAEQQQEQIEANAFGDAVAIDTVNGAAGTLFPLGTPGAPVDNLADALTIATARGLRKFVLAGSITLGAALNNWRVEGIAGNNLVSIVNLGGFDVAGTEFKNVALSGTSIGFFTGEGCEFFGTLNGIQGIFERCTLLGTVTPAADQDLWLLSCYSGVAGLSTPTLNLTNMAAGGSVSVRAYSGGLNVTNCNVGAFASTFEFVAGQIILAASLTAGTFAVRGVVDISDNSAGATISTEAALARSPIGDVVWDEALSGHLVAGTAGEALQVLLDIVAGDTRITNSGLDWVEEHLDYATGLVVQRRYDLFGFDAGQITDTNNPFTASGISRDTGFMSRVRTL